MSLRLFAGSFVSLLGCVSSFLCLLFICLFVCFSGRLFVCLFVCLFPSLFVRLFVFGLLVYLSVRFFGCKFIFPFIFLCVHVFVCSFVCIFVCLCVQLFVC